MGRPQVVELTSVAEVREAAPRWDDLWQRSAVASPTLRAEMVAQWIEQFAPSRRVHVLVVEDEGRWLAGLPLVQSPRSRLPVGEMTSNDWSSSGDLLLDPEADDDATLDAMAHALNHAPWPLICLDDVPVHTPRWLAMREALQRRRVASDLREQNQIGLIEIGSSWEAFEHKLAKRDRQKMARCSRRLSEKGDVELRWLSDLAPCHVEEHLRIAMEIEDRGWKGEAGTSVLRTPGLYDFFVRQAEQLAAWGQLELALLYCGDRPISFVYGYAGKGVSCWHKIGYLSEEGCCSPGQLAQWELLRRLHGMPGRIAVDTLGPLTRALSLWNPKSYQTGRILVCGGMTGAAVLAGVRRWRALRRRGHGLVPTDVPCSDRGRPPLSIRKHLAGFRGRRIRRGDFVEVLSEEEIRATLDAHGSLDGLPFMPGMTRHCRGRFRVFRRVEKVFVDHYHEVRRMKDAVLLEDLRCDGHTQNGCQMGCMILWKESWLKPATDKAVSAPGEPSGPRPPAKLHPSSPPQLPLLEKQRFSCQATELIHATTPLPWWDLRQYVRDVIDARVPPAEVLRTLAILTHNKLQRMRGTLAPATVQGELRKTPTQQLNLQPGDLVQIKGKEEIKTTLDADGRNRGLSFGGDMIGYCGGRYRVAKRVEKLIVEWTGEMRPIRDTVALEGVTCTALQQRGCPRNCYHLWREIWLRKVEEPAAQGTEPSEGTCTLCSDDSENEPVPDGLGIGV